MITAQKTLFPELNVVRNKKRQRRDPFGRYDTQDRFESYEKKIARQRETIKYLLGVMGSHADAIRKRDLRIIELEFQLSQRNSIE